MSTGFCREIHVVSLCENRFQSFLLLSKSDRVELGSIKIKSSNRMFWVLTRMTRERRAPSIFSWAILSRHEALWLRQWLWIQTRISILYTSGFLYQFLTCDMLLQFLGFDGGRIQLDQRTREWLSYPMQLLGFLVLNGCYLLGIRIPARVYFHYSLRL